MAGSCKLWQPAGQTVRGIVLDHTSNAFVQTAAVDTSGATDWEHFTHCTSTGTGTGTGTGTARTLPCSIPVIAPTCWPVFPAVRVGVVHSTEDSYHPL